MGRRPAPPGVSLLLHTLILTHLLLLSFLLPFTHAKADFSLYHPTDALLSQLSSIAAHNPTHLTQSSCPSTPTIPLYTLTSPSPLSQLSSPKLRLLLNFGEHGRELITSEVALTFLSLFDLTTTTNPTPTPSPIPSSPDPFEYARIPPSSPPSSSSLSSPPPSPLSPELLRHLTRNTRTTVIPLLNEWGRRQVEAGHACSRKNRNGVDLNRNYDFLFDSNRRPPADETYQGVAAFSEEESRCVRDVAVREMVDVYVNVHSGIKELYFGWDHRGDVMLPNMREVTRLYERVNAHHCSCRVGSAGKIAGYVVYGGSMDWLYVHTNTSYSLTYEVYGAEEAMTRGDCYTAFNPTTAQQLHDTTTAFATSFITIQLALIEEKLGIPYPYQPPSFLLTPLFMQEDRKTRDAVRLHYHPWRLILPRFPSSSSSLGRTSHPLPVYDPHQMLTSPSPTDPNIPLRVMIVADAAYNHHFTTELLWHLTYQLEAQDYARQLQLLLVPSLFPLTRPDDDWCWEGLDAPTQQLKLAELYRSEEELERISRHIRPHLLIELRQSNSTSSSSSHPKRDAFDLLYHNTSTSSPTFISSLLSALSDDGPSSPTPFTSPLSLTTHLHLRLVYRGWTAPPNPDPSSQRRRVSDRRPPESYRTQAVEPYGVVRCDWPGLNPDVEGMREYVGGGMRGLHGVLGVVGRVGGGEEGGKGVGLAVVRREEEEAEGEGEGRMGGGTRSVLVNGDVMEFGEGSGWMPSVWAQGGVGWKAWLLLGALVALCAVLAVAGWRLFRQTHDQLKAQETL